MSATGSPSIGANNLTLAASNAPSSTYGLFLFGQGVDSTPLGNGTNCISNRLGRFAVLPLIPGHTAHQSVDLTQMPNGYSLQPGHTLLFQYMFRDAAAGGAGFDLLTNVIIVMTLIAGTAMIMWMGELITQRGVGNGMSLLIFASIVSTFPAQGISVQRDNGWFALAILVAMVIALTVAIVYVEQGQRRIPVQFAKRVVGRRMYGGQNTYIPLKVNQSGVIPIIFASSVLYLPQLLAVALPFESFQSWVNNNLSQPDNLWYYMIFGVLILGFAYFYTAITFDPAKQADTIRKQGGFIPGIRPGPQTERYLSKILSRITLPGAVFILLVALVPSIIIWQLGWAAGGGNSSAGAGNFGFLGISILIAAGVALETMRQIDSQLTMRNYEGFLAK